MAEQLPQKFGSYTLQKLIARGGMAEIYRATMPGIGGFEKTVAIKKILPHLAEDAEFVTMLKDEANILVSISDANIAQVYDLGRIGDSYFIAMEYVHGLDLSHVIKGVQKHGESIPVDHALYIASCICAGLHAAHTNTDKQGNPLDIVHRDVSPHNVIISFAGDVKLIDFGVAKASAKESHTQVGVIKGKLLYMAPEQAMAKSLDGRADLFAAGLCLYKMLTNKLPFRGENEFQIYNNILSKEIVPPRELNAQISQEVNQIVMTLLQRDPDKRYQDGYSAKQDLRRALHNLAPGYTVNRLGHFIEDHFSEAAQRRRKARHDSSGHSGMAPKTPSATSVGTGQLLADADIQEIDIDSLDTMEADRLQIPSPASSPPTPATSRAMPPPTPGHAPAPKNTNLRTKNSAESTNQFHQNQLSSPADAQSSPKTPAAFYIIGALVLVICILVGVTFLGDTKQADAPLPDAPEAANTAPSPAPAAAPVTVTVQLDSDPSGAELLRGTDLLGTTPRELTLRRSADPISITFRMEGYEPRDIQLIPDENTSQVISLTPAEDPGDEDALNFDPEEAPKDDQIEPGSKPSTAPAAPKPTQANKPDARAPKPAKTAGKDRPKNTEQPASQKDESVPALDEGIDLWDNASDDAPKKDDKETSKKPEAPKKPTKKPAKKPEKDDDKPEEILNPFG